MRRAPAHAGRLRPWERSVFALVFALMLAFVVVITLTAGKSGGLRGSDGTSLGASSLKAGTTGQHTPPAGPAAPNSSRAVAESITRSARLDRALGRALTGLVRRPGRQVAAGRLAAGRLAVGVIDVTSGDEAVFHGSASFRAAGLANPDLVAALLLQEQAGRPVSNGELGQAAAMIQEDSDASAALMWKRVHAGLAAANATLKLRHTSGRRPASLTTTVTDLLQLLTDLSSPRSPLSLASREYLLGLMTGAGSGQQWGVPAAASGGTGYAVTDGWLAEGGRWVLNSAGIVRYRGRELLIAVLSGGSSSKARGESLVQAAVLAAARTITARS